MPEPRKMFAVQITRKDGSTFLSSQGPGDTPTVWAPCNRKRAVAWKRELRFYELNAKVVPILYTEPVIL